MMIATAAFIRGEAAAANKKKGHLSWKPHDQSKKHTDKRPDFRAADANKFQPPPPMVTPVEKRNGNKFCDFHNDKGHNIDECMQLKKQIKELVRAGKLSHLIKEIKQGREQPKTGRKEATTKDKPMTIYMVRSWQRTVKQKITQSFEQGKEITFPPLANSHGTEGPLVIEEETNGPSDYVTNWIQWRDYMAARTTKTPGNHRRRHPFYQSMDELHDCEVAVTLQRHYWTIGAKSNSSNTIYRVPLHLNFPDQEVVVGGSLSDKGRTELCSLLKNNLDIFAWQPFDMTGVPRSVEEHRLNVREGCPLDCYPLPEIDWKVESLCGYPFKCFLDAYKGYHQIQMAVADEEKIAFHIGQGVYCYTKMPFGLKNAGTTGKPKGVMLSHSALVVQSLAKIAAIGYSEDDVYLHTAPLGHVGGLSSALAMLMVGACHVLMPKFEAKSALEAIEKYNVTSFITVPAIMSDIISLIRTKDARKELLMVTKILNGGGSLSDKLVKDATDIFSNASLYTAYGMTEGSSSLTFMTLHDPTKQSTTYKKSTLVKQQQGVCVGKPAPHVELKISTEDSSHVGQILTRGPHLMIGYWDHIPAKENPGNEG
nr:2-succinylbenzoate--CoA ligase, chloroplastic/peroxisomal [Tanacetum cinerariifolium]